MTGVTHVAKVTRLTGMTCMTMTTGMTRMTRLTMVTRKNSELEFHILGTETIDIVHEYMQIFRNPNFINWMGGATCMHMHSLKSQGPKINSSTLRNIKINNREQQRNKR